MSAPADPIDFPALDAAIERCQLDTVRPIFAAETQRRSAFITAVYTDQAAISAARLALADKRRALREAPLQPPPAGAAPAAPAETDQQLALAERALDDRQHALDDRRRLEALRQEAVDLKRSYFLAHCPPGKKRG
jgi:hypothetical protein